MITLEEVLRRRQRWAKRATAGNHAALPALRVRVLSSFNADLLNGLLGEAGERAGLWLTPSMGPFGRITAEALDPEAETYGLAPEVVVLIAAAEDLLQPLFHRPASFTAESAETLVEDRLSELRTAVHKLSAGLPGATLLIVPFGAPQPPADHVLRCSAAERGEGPLERFLQGVKAFEQDFPTVVIADWQRVIRAVGWTALQDDRMWYLGRMRLGMVGAAHLADLLAGVLATQRGLVKKVAALDLDNTLWGGVVGEAGVEGLELGNEGVGLAFQEFQRELLRWHDAGTLLTIVSKNNEDDAWAVFEQHPDMVLKKEHFAGWRINWQDKASNLQELAEELNLGLDSFVFFDDNPVERGWVAQALPMVVVPELPAEPTAVPRFARGLPYFRRLQVTDADRKRVRSYQWDHQRRELKAAAADMQGYLASLEQVLRYDDLQPAMVARAAQMCQRTNQFNLSTKRYAAAELQALAADPAVEVVVLSVRDRFDDYGAVGLGILRHSSAGTEIDTLLMSCRVLGRQVESDFLAELTSRARRRGSSQLFGCYVRTAKNGQVDGFLQRVGLQPDEQGAFSLALGDAEAAATG